jgi:GT2 family glycosyltransferase
LVVIDNDAPKELSNWLDAEFIAHPRYSPQIGVTRAWNIGLEAMFDFMGADHCLVVNNDVELPTWFYRGLLQFPQPGLVSGISTNTHGWADFGPPINSPSVHPDFSAFLIRRWLWRELDGFDERMVNYASDNDLHVRAQQAGHTLINSGLPFYHERSSTMRAAGEEERAALEKQADADRRVFQAKWGCLPWEPAYAELFK